SPGSLWHHQGSSWSREQLLAVPFNTSIQFNSNK
ncbi:unnamed protein product, partial [Rotaria socialis]